MWQRDGGTVSAPNHGLENGGPNQQILFRLGNKAEVRHELAKAAYPKRRNGNHLFWEDLRSEGEESWQLFISLHIYTVELCAGVEIVGSGFALGGKAYAIPLL